MKSTLFLRIASVLTLLLCLGHSMGRPWTPDTTPRGLALMAEMQAYSFDVMGFSRSYYDFYEGFGLSCSVGMLLAAVLMWQLATMAKTDARATRPMLTAIFLAFAGYLVLDWFYFFTAPLVLTAPVVVLLGVALALSGHASSNPQQSAQNG
jgi:Zn-dependent protease with chaperone function